MAEMAGVLFTKEIAKNLFETFDRLNRFVRDENFNMGNNFTSLGDFASSINPLALPIQNVLNQIKQETLDEALHIMKESLELASNPLVSASITLLGKLISKVLNNVSDGLDEVSLALKKIHTLGEIIKAFVKDPGGTIVDLWNVFMGMGD